MDLITSLVAQYRPQIHVLWDELADYSPGDINDAVKFCMRTLCEWIDVQNAFWIGTVRMAADAQTESGTLYGWRIMAADVLNPECTSPERLARGMKMLSNPDPGMETRAMMAGAGEFRVHSFHSGAFDLAQFKQTDHFDFFYRERNINDRMWVVFPINEDVELYYLFDTYEDGRCFTAAERELLGEALRGLKWFHRQLLLNRGLGICKEPLTPAERRVIPDILTGATEKIMAVRLNLTQATVHQYVTRVYKKFGVRGRTAFMALWLKGRM